MKQEKILAEDLEVEDCIWIDKFNEYKLISEISENLNNDIVVTFDSGETIFLKRKQELFLM